MCPLDFEVITKITAYNEDDVTMPDLYLRRDLLSLSLLPVKSPNSGFSLLTEFNSIKFSQTESSEHADCILKNTVKFDMIFRESKFKQILSQLKRLSKRHHHLALETMSGHVFWLPSHPDSSFSYSQEANKISGSFVIENLCGPILIG